MEEITILVKETPEALELQKSIIELIEKSGLAKSAIVLPGIIKQPK